MTRAGTGCCAALLVLLTGCVVPTTGPSALRPPSSVPAFDVEVVAPGEVVADDVGGVIEVNGRGATALVTGWVPDPEATVLVVSPERREVVEVQRLQHVEASGVMGLPVEPGLGFRMRLRNPDGLVSGNCLLARQPDGTVYLLEGSDPAVCPAP